MSRAPKLLPALVVIAAIVPASAAQAHVSIHPNTIPAGAFAALEVRVPGERQGAHVRKVDVLLPAGFIGVSYESIPGWTVKVVETKLAKPIQSDDGPIDTEVSQIIWSWTGPLGRVDDGQFIDLPLSVAIPEDAAGQPLLFKTVEIYSDGEIARWIDPALDAEHPAPRINVTSKGGAIEDLAGEEAGPTPRQTSPSSSASGTAATTAKSSGNASEGLGVASLILGAFGLLLGGSAVLYIRRSSRR